ncbi:2'-5' RNA ligase family protein [Nocardioides KLBMP 9356]|uniref:2'-5' RNA ligase family protein n=1 Tax=Nocardioides potassii TaxID=2911371 RepID=A0ABS9HG29_9ACTN|nr:2'-5' RNA ligase family protein [Nocardioides potassii]MCF6379273.1 2'-5' RNA ligase family protein [Nocardioides potassii]
MYLTAALVPPDRITAAARDAAVAASERLPRLRLTERWDDVVSVPSFLPSPTPWEALPLDRMDAELARFGYVAPDEVATMRRIVAGLIAPHDAFTVSLGGSVRVDHVRRLVLLGVQGETDRLETVFDALHASVHRAGFARDRRRFRPMVPVLSFGPHLRLGELVRTVEALEGYVSDPWSVTSIGLVHRELSSRDARPTELDRLPLSA